MLDLQFIKTKVEEQIAVVTLDNPPVNILTSHIMKEIDDTELDKLQKELHDILNEKRAHEKSSPTYPLDDLSTSLEKLKKSLTNLADGLKEVQKRR